MSDGSVVVKGDRPIGVLGATGQQGGAVVDALLDRGRGVRAVVRRTDSDSARTLAERGVEVVPGDQDDPDSLVEPLAGLTALFVMTTYAGAAGVRGEVARGEAVAEAAARADVPRVVYSSVGGAERDTGVPHFESKHRVEQRLEELLPVQFVRPTFFMENLLEQIRSASPGEFVLRLPMPGDVALQMVAVRDIGRVAAAALDDPEALGGLSLEIAGDELTGDQAARVIGEHLGADGRFEQLPLSSLGEDTDRRAMFRWFVDTPAYQADLERTRAVAHDVLDLRSWLEAGAAAGESGAS